MEPFWRGSSAMGAGTLSMPSASSRRPSRWPVGPPQVHTAAVCPPRRAIARDTFRPPPPAWVTGALHRSFSSGTTWSTSAARSSDGFNVSVTIDGMALPRWEVATPRSDHQFLVGLVRATDAERVEGAGRAGGRERRQVVAGRGAVPRDGGREGPEHRPVRGEAAQAPGGRELAVVAGEGVVVGRAAVVARGGGREAVELADGRQRLGELG